MRALAAAVTLLTTVAVGQPTPAQPPLTAEADPGVRLTRLIDRAEVRVSRLEIEPGAVRRAHAHNDVEYHLWIPIEGSLQITIGSDAPAAAAPGQAFFLKRGTTHGFKNVGATRAAVFEIFIKQTTVAAGRGAGAGGTGGARGAAGVGGTGAAGEAGGIDALELLAALHAPLK